MNSLLVSWNFDNLTGSDNFGCFTVSDTVNAKNGFGDNFLPNSSKFLLKEDIKTNRKVFIDSLEFDESIRCLEEDDSRVDLTHKPSTNVLLIENSMYQIMSEEMMNIFSSIDAYSFKFSEPSNKYKNSYKELEKTRNEFFSKILNKPNVEKYIEFYKWIDSSLGYLIEQLKPENSNTITGLKNTIESHILERNKYEYKIPLTFEENRIFTNTKKIIKKNLLGSSRTTKKTFSNDINDLHYLENNEKIKAVDITNKENKNFFKNYEILHSSGKVTESRSNKKNKTIFKTKFSSADGDSDKNRDWSHEYSRYNSLNNKSFKLRQIYNSSQAQSTGIQGSNTDQDFADNNFIQRNIPYKDENYSNISSSLKYQNIPSRQVNFYRNTNILVDLNSGSYLDSKDIVEPPIEFNTPLKFILKLKEGLEYINIYSPYNSLIDTFSIRNIQKDNNLLDKIFSKTNIDAAKKDTFFFKANKLLNDNLLTIEKLENLNIIFPRTDLIGLARVRTKTQYEEQEGTFQKEQFLKDLQFSLLSNLGMSPWSDNSYNNESGVVRSFWRSNRNQRKRTRGADFNSVGDPYQTGSFGCYAYPNIIQDKIEGENYIYYDPNIYNSMWSMDCNINFSYESISNQAYLFSYSETYGELAPYSHFYQSRFYYAQSEDINNLHFQPKPQFIHNIFLHRTALSALDGHLQFIFNKSYQGNLDCKIEPFYDTYEDYRENIKHKSQNMSIVPEFITSRFNELIDNGNAEANNFIGSINRCNYSSVRE